MVLKILWLCSWYPSDEHPYDGDFVKRYADAVSILYKIDVVYVQKQIETNVLPTYTKTKRSKNLTEHIYANNVKSTSAFHTFIGILKFFLIHYQFIKKNGKPDLIHVQVPIKSGIVALFYKFFCNIPYVITEHNGFYNLLATHHFKTRSFAFRHITKLILKYADVLTTVSNSLGEDINSWVIKKEFKVIPNVVDTSIFHFELPIVKSKFQFIHISNMVPLKNVRGIIEAIEILRTKRKDFKMIFIGNIENEFYQLALSKNLLNDVIFFEGEIPYNMVSTKIIESDALIIFSDSESQSCVVLEALCSGRPVIVTNVGGVKELVNNENGYKVNARDTHNLMITMNEMINNYTSFNLKDISEKASNNYSYNTIANQFKQVYEIALRKSS